MLWEAMSWCQLLLSAHLYCYTGIPLPYTPGYCKRLQADIGVSPGMWGDSFTCQMETRIMMRIYQLWLPETSRCPGIALFQDSMLSE